MIWAMRRFSLPEFDLENITRLEFPTYCHTPVTEFPPVLEDIAVIVMMISRPRHASKR